CCGSRAEIEASLGAGAHDNRTAGQRGMAMRFLLLLLIALICCGAVAVAVLAWRTGRVRLETPLAAGPPSLPGRPRSAPVGLEMFPDPNAQGTSSEVFIDQRFFDADIFNTAIAFTGPIRDPRSLESLREAVRGRGRRGIAALRKQYDSLGGQAGS